MRRGKKRLYIHIPFCIKRCHYCDFVSSVLKDKKDLSNYIDYLSLELELYKDKLKNDFITIYIGGGTPSLFEPHEIYALGELLFKYLNPPEEFTIEANPESITQDKILTWRDIGINRISLGVQSFDDEILSFLGRPHTASDAIDAISILKDYFDNVSFDFIYGIPGQKISAWHDTLKKAITFGPQHLSLYALSIEEDTPFYEGYKRGKIHMMDESLVVDMYEFGVRFLKENGYKRYEISNFSLPGKESIHNMGYWTYDEYLGIGVSASSFIEGVRYTNYSSMTDYFKSLKNGIYPIAYREKLSKEKMMGEYIILRLRTDRGLLIDEFIDIFGIDPLSIYKDKFDYFIDLGFMEHTEYGYRLTDKGVLVSNQIFMEII